MPCYTRKEVTLDLQVADEDVLAKGLHAAGFRAYSHGRMVRVISKTGVNATIHLATGTVVVDTVDEPVVNEIKRAYTNEVVRQAAKRFGWTLTATKQENQFVAARRF